MVALLRQLESSEPTILELYSPLFQSDNPQYKIIGSKYLAVNIYRFRVCWKTSREKNKSPSFLKSFSEKEDNSKKFMP